MALARFHLLVNFYFPSPFWEKNEFNEITLIFEMTKDAICFFDTEIQLELKLQEMIELDKMKRFMYLSSFVDYFFYIIFS